VVRPDLKLVAGREERATRGAVVLLAGTVLVLALAATYLGADRARATDDPAEAMSRALLAVPPGGAPTDELRAAARSLRRRLGEAPADARTRAIYASALLELGGGGPAGGRPARFHAEQAAASAPVAVPVVSGAAIVLATAGDVDRALGLARDMFGYDPRSAARLLLALSSLADTTRIDAVLPPSPDAWLAWWSELARAGRGHEAERVLDGAFERWPEDAATIRAVASRSAERRDWKRLREVLPASIPETADVATAALLAYRARLRAETGDPQGGKEDARAAVLRAPESVSVLVLAGDAMAAAKAPDEARMLLSRALYRVPKGPAERLTRVSILARKARLFEQEGMLADAVRTWRAVVTADPGHAEAKERLDRLPGAGS
jgi:tetratricopeptide (TPR) repeat protein